MGAPAIILLGAILMGGVIGAVGAECGWSLGRTLLASFVFAVLPMLAVSLAALS